MARCWEYKWPAFWKFKWPDHLRNSKGTLLGIQVARPILTPPLLKVSEQELEYRSAKSSQASCSIDRWEEPLVDRDVPSSTHAE